MLEINQLTKFYESKKVLDSLNLNINKGEICGLLGANGAGKTTTINIICGLLNYEKGSIFINGQKLSKKSKYYLGVSPQENLLYSHLTCVENLAFFGKLYGLKGTKLKSSIYECLKAVNLLDKKDDTVSALSGGMQRKLNIAIALVHHPLLLILDEPTTGLDIEARYDIWQLILRLKQEGMTILLTTHLLDEAEKLCDRLCIIKQGKIVKEGSLNDLKNILPAKELIFIKCEQEEKLIEMAKKQGFNYRYYQGEIAILSEEILELSTIIDIFSEIYLTSVTKVNINLQHIYLEIINNE
ncbi:ABC transporter ATP-binding protein [Cyanobacterium aponinum FACHB-4101]|uniref:ABC transporter ATP-binding protein n=1 Tax=Cyanobacterium aponinum TaxID=379064 RepID=UPI00168121A8|nr:ABC transporter ATP-binding protein [Cyanobacterium aponinum]MBD2392892.1 ABC transporter ATP-binding protein [Cyanobacterium aponinum FACHB-4101]